MDWRAVIFALAQIERPSASAGERRAAQVLAERLRELGCEVAVEPEPAHGGYWWPLGLANALAGAAALLARRRGTRLRRAAAAVAGGISAAAVWDDVSGGALWFRRALLPHRATWNVIGRIGPRDAERTIVFIAHHDAAHSGLVFHPALGRFPPRFIPRLHERSNQSLPILYAVWLGPVLAGLGALLGRRGVLSAAATLSAGAAGAMADIGRRDTVPGANDNLSAVGALLALADRLAQRPPEGLQVILLSTGSEESFMEGMQGFARSHFGELDPARTEMICLECVGGPELIVLEGEGMLHMRDYPADLREALAAAAAEAGVEIGRGLRTVAATDALIALRRGFRVATLASIDYTKLPLNYHWPTDVPEALHWGTIERAIAVCERFVAARCGHLTPNPQLPQEAVT